MKPTPCAVLECRGRVQDGYCDVCGAPAAALEPETVPTAPPARAAGRFGGRRAGGLGAGLVELPLIAPRDPAAAILDDPHVPEEKRFCGGCDTPAGRSAPGVPARTEGFCPSCGARYAFVPALKPGDIVAGQYEVAGCLARGGLGWIHLARDRNVSGRWVVLKGLVSAADPDAVAAARAERAYLAEIAHPDFVEIFNYVKHDGDGYIVMEYVGGRSLRDLALEYRDESREMPLPYVLAYGLESLGALAHLHDKGLLFCDFKPANVLHDGSRLRIIDLGGVRRIDDLDAAIYGTVGFQAPEIADDGPSVSSDLYTVARTMAVLSFPFTGYTNEYRHSLPDADRIPLLKRHESYRLLLRRATHPDPGQRFQSAWEMADQLTGVLREVLATADGQARTATSTLFRSTGRIGREATGRLAAPDRSVAAVPDPVPPADATDRWYTDWEEGRSLLAGDAVDPAATAFTRVRGMLPGEAAPSLALGLCAELAGDHRAAEGHYTRVMRLEPSDAAAFGAGRSRLECGDRPGALAAFLAVPDTSAAHEQSRVAAVMTLLGDRRPPGIAPAEVREAAAILGDAGLPDDRHDRLAALVLEAALGRVLAVPGEIWRPGVPPLPAVVAERSLRSELEGVYRRLAGRRTRRERADLVQLANDVRPRIL